MTLKFKIRHDQSCLSVWGWRVGRCSVGIDPWTQENRYMRWKVWTTILILSSILDGRLYEIKLSCIFFLFSSAFSILLLWWQVGAPYLFNERVIAKRPTEQAILILYLVLNNISLFKMRVKTWWDYSSGYIYLKIRWELPKEFKFL